MLFRFGGSSHTEGNGSSGSGSSLLPPKRRKPKDASHCYAPSCSQSNGCNQQHDMNSTSLSSGYPSTTSQSYRCGPVWLQPHRSTTNGVDGNAGSEEHCPGVQMSQLTVDSSFGRSQRSKNSSESMPPIKAGDIPMRQPSDSWSYSMYLSPPESHHRHLQHQYLHTQLHHDSQGNIKSQRKILRGSSNSGSQNTKTARFTDGQHQEEAPDCGSANNNQPNVRFFPNGLSSSRDSRIMTSSRSTTSSVSHALGKENKQNLGSSSYIRGSNFLKKKRDPISNVDPSTGQFKKFAIIPQKQAKKQSYPSLGLQTIPEDQLHGSTGNLSYPAKQLRQQKENNSTFDPPTIVMEHYAKFVRELENVVEQKKEEISRRAAEAGVKMAASEASFQKTVDKGLMTIEERVDAKCDESLKVFDRKVEESTKKSIEVIDSKKKEGVAELVRSVAKHLEKLEDATRQCVLQIQETGNATVAFVFNVRDEIIGKIEVVAYESTAKMLKYLNETIPNLSKTNNDCQDDLMSLPKATECETKARKNNTKRFIQSEPRNVIVSPFPKDLGRMRSKGTPSEGPHSVEPIPDDRIFSTQNKSLQAAPRIARARTRAMAARLSKVELSETETNELAPACSEADPHGDGNLSLGSSKPSNHRLKPQKEMVAKTKYPQKLLDVSLRSSEAQKKSKANQHLDKSSSTRKIDKSSISQSMRTGAKAASLAKEVASERLLTPIRPIVTDRRTNPKLETGTLTPKSMTTIPNFHRRRPSRKRTAATFIPKSRPSRKRTKSNDGNLKLQRPPLLVHLPTASLNNIVRP